MRFWHGASWTCGYAMLVDEVTVSKESKAGSDKQPTMTEILKHVEEKIATHGGITYAYNMTAGIDGVHC